jgi:tetratricopeptide (TPR) repeat protein
MELQLSLGKWITLLILSFFLNATAFAQTSTTTNTTLSADERFQLSVKKNLEKKYFESAVILKRLIYENPNKSIYWFNFANNLYMLRRYKAALKYYEKVISLNTKFVTPARLYKIKTLMALGLLDEAESYINSYINEKPKASTLQILQIEQQRAQFVRTTLQTAYEAYKENNFQQVDLILMQLEPKTISVEGAILQSLSYYKQQKYKETRQSLLSAKKNLALTPNQQEAIEGLLLKTQIKLQDRSEYDYFAKVEMGHNSNIFSDGNSVESQASSLIRAEAALNFLLINKKSVSLYLGYNLFYENPTEVSELQSLYHTLDSNINYETDLFDIKARPYFQMQNWSSRNEIQKIGLDSSLVRVTKVFNYGLNLNLSSKKALSTDYSYLSGNDYSLSPYVGYLIDRWYSEFFISAGADVVGDITYADGAVLPLKHNFYGLGFKLNYEINENQYVLSQVTYSVKNFSSLTQPTQEKRIDQQLGVNAQYFAYILPKLKFNVTLEYVNNRSTLGSSEVRDKNYNINYLGVGLTWEGQ